MNDDFDAKSHLERISSTGNISPSLVAGGIQALADLICMITNDSAGGALRANTIAAVIQLQREVGDNLQGAVADATSEPGRVQFLAGELLVFDSLIKSLIPQHPVSEPDVEAESAS